MAWGHLGMLALFHVLGLRYSGLDVTRGGLRALVVLHTGYQTLAGDGVQDVGPDKVAGGADQMTRDPDDVGTYHVWDGCTASGPSAVVETAVVGYAVTGFVGALPCCLHAGATCLFPSSWTVLAYVGEGCPCCLAGVVESCASLLEGACGQTVAFLTVTHWLVEVVLPAEVSAVCYSAPLHLVSPPGWR